VYLKLYVGGMTIIAPSGYDDLPRLMSRMTGAEKHSAAATSTLDVVWVLYDRVLDVVPDRLDDPHRDRFVLSKGHGPMAYYAVLAATGFIPVDWLDGWAGFDSPLGMHPDRVLVPGVEVGSGSLGHGLPIALGMALGMRATRRNGRVFCVVGDGELDEGSNAEAIEATPRLGVTNLTTVVIDNGSSSLGWSGGIASRFAVAGWSAVDVDVDGRAHDALATALTAHDERPHVVVAHVERRDG
jgi:transketolase